MTIYKRLLIPVRKAADVPTPAAGKVEVFVDDVTLHLSQKDEDGIVTDLADGGASKSPDGNTYTEVVNGAINFVVDGNPVGNVVYDTDLGMPKWTISGGLDPAYYQGTPQTIAQRDALVATNPTAKAGWLVYVVDGTTKEYQEWDGATWKPFGAVAASTTQTQLFVRDNATKGVAPDTTEWADPKDTDRAIVVLDDGTTEYSEYQTDKWVLLKTLAGSTTTDTAGDFFGAASTYATLPTTLTLADSTVMNVGFGDFAELIKDDGTNKAGYYQWTGSAYVLNTALEPKPKGIGRGNALPADNASFEEFILEGHASLPRGLYWFSAESTTWVQA